MFTPPYLYVRVSACVYYIENGCVTEMTLCLELPFIMRIMTKLVFDISSYRLELSEIFRPANFHDDKSTN